MPCKSFTFNFNLNDPELPLKTLRMTYEHFLSFEHSAGQKDLWLEQKKVYEEIFNAKDTLQAAKDFRALGKKTSDVARERIKLRNG